MTPRFLNLMLLTLALTGCAIVKDPVQVVRTCESGEALAGFVESVFAITSVNCASCHAQTRTPLLASATTRRAYSQALTVVSLVDPAASKIVKKVSDGHCGTACDNKGADMVRAIEQWKSAEERATQGCKKPVPTDGPDDPTPAPESGGGEEFSNPRTIRSAPFTIPANIPTSETVFTEISIPLPGGLAGSMLIEIQRFSARTAVDSGSYRIRRPRLFISGSNPAIYLKDMGVSINDADASVFTVYHGVDTSVTPVAAAANAPLLSPLMSDSIPQEQDTGDQIILSFRVLQATETPNCKRLTEFTNLVLNAQGGGYASVASSCVGCHQAGSAYPLAAARMPLTGAAVDICRRMIQRVNKDDPNQSAIIRQPAAGTNGHPVTGGDFSRFIQWIEAERDAP